MNEKHHDLDTGEQKNGARKVDVLMLQQRIKQAWSHQPPLPNTEIAESTELERMDTERYFVDRALTDVDPGDPSINGMQPYNEAFTPAAKRYYAGAYLAYLLKAYACEPPEDADMAVLHFRSFLLSDEAMKMPFTDEQTRAIADVLNFVANRVDADGLSDDQIEELLRGVDYWNEKAREKGGGA